MAIAERDAVGHGTHAVSRANSQNCQTYGAVALVVVGPVRGHSVRAMSLPGQRPDDRDARSPIPGAGLSSSVAAGPENRHPTRRWRSSMVAASAVARSHRTRYSWRKLPPAGCAGVGRSAVCAGFATSCVETVRYRALAIYPAECAELIVKHRQGSMAVSGNRGSIGQRRSPVDGGVE